MDFLEKKTEIVKQLFNKYSASKRKGVSVADYARLKVKITFKNKNNTPVSLSNVKKLIGKEIDIEELLQKAETQANEFFEAKQTSEKNNSSSEVSATVLNFEKGGKLFSFPKLLENFIPDQELKTLKQNLKGEEAEFFEGKLTELENLILEMPETYGQEGLGNNTFAFLHYFGPLGDYYITEKDAGDTEENEAKSGLKVDKQSQAFGLVINTYGQELGSISIEEFVQYKHPFNEMQLDLYFTPKPLSQVKDEKPDKIESQKQYDRIKAIAEKYGYKESSENKEKNEESQKESIISKKYKNPYELNKAIEAFLSEKTTDFTKEERDFIKQFSGYGGLRKYLEKGEYSNKVEQEFYTPETIVARMIALVKQFGYKEGGAVLEPAAGIGAFLDYFPAGTPLATYEINETSHKILKILYPHFTHRNKSFETLFIEKNSSIRDKLGDLFKYDLVIGNPPYADYKTYYKGLGEDYTGAKNHIDYFVFRGLDVLNSGGLLAYIVGAEQRNGGRLWLDQQRTKIKEKIATKANLIHYERYPAVFDRTTVVSDIIIFRKK